MFTLLRRIMALSLATALPLTTTACYDWTGRGPEVAANAQNVTDSTRIIGLVTTGGDVIEFESGAKISNGEVVGKSKKGEKVRIPLDRVQRVTIAEHKFSTAKTIGLAASLIGVGLVAAAASWGSGSDSKATTTSKGGCCPFFYSWDGSQFTFDAEPYPGAITRGLERDGDVVLDRLRAEGGHYQVLMTNERDETEYTDHVALRVIDHERGIRIAPGGDGTLYALSQTVAPVSARTSDGRDLLQWLVAADALIYEPVPDSGASDEIVLTFPKPAGAQQARLVVNVGASLLSSLMLTEYLSLHGRDLPAWFEQVDSDPATVMQLYRMIGETQTWALGFDIERSGGWTSGGHLLGVGPLIVKDRVVPLDLTGLAGTELRVRVRPPRGFWALNSFSVDYSPAVPITAVEVPLTRAIGGGSSNRLAALAAADGSYDVMPAGSEPVLLTFPAPPERAGLSRTVVLHARGWYRENVVAKGEPALEILRRFENEPGFASRLAAEHWKTMRERRQKPKD